jgi:tetratricopeptide (TPR) repeat protein
MIWLLALFLAAPQYDLTDERGKKPPGVTIEAGEADADGWFLLKLALSKGARDPVLVWPFDGTTKLPAGPVIVIQRGDERALQNRHVVAAIAASKLLGGNPDAGLDITQALPGLEQSTDAFEKGVGLLSAGKSSEAIDALARALRERQRQLTPMPQEIYAAAILYGQALSAEKKYDGAAVAFQAAIKQRPSASLPRQLRADALLHAGKPEAAGR